MTSKTRKAHAVAVMEDRRMAEKCLMEVDDALQRTATACRALAHDASKLKDPELTASVKKLLADVEAVRQGPTTEFWNEIRNIDTSANRLYNS